MDGVPPAAKSTRRMMHAKSSWSVGRRNFFRGASHDEVLTSTILVVSSRQWKLQYHGHGLKRQICAGHLLLLEDAVINDEEPSSITLHERAAGHAPRFWTRLGCHVSA